MGRQYEQIEPAHTASIAAQHIFFAATTAATGRVNVSLHDTTACQELLDTVLHGHEPPGAHKIIRLDVDRVQISDGYSMLLFDYKKPRSTLSRWAAAKAEDGLDACQAEKNRQGLGGFPITGVVLPEEAA